VTPPAISEPGDHAATAEENRSAELERQVERASLFTHTVIGLNAAILAEVESLLYGVIDLLLAKGTVAADEIGEAAKKVSEEASARGDVPSAASRSTWRRGTGAERPCR
jgi:hypothetical protein